MATRQSTKVLRACETCNTPTRIFPSTPNKRFCSRQCRKASPHYWRRSTPRPSDAERFAVLVAAPNERGCTLWQGRLADDRYGSFSVPGRTPHDVRAHRYAWELAHGPIAAGMFVCHKCDTPLCVNVDHLFLGTNCDNVADMIAKGRCPSGERRYNHKLTAAAVREIRRDASSYSREELARRFGVTRAAVRQVLIGKSWKHVV